MGVPGRFLYKRGMYNTWVMGAAVLALLLFWAVGAYNRLVRLRAAIGAAFAALDARFAERLAWLGSMLEPVDGPPDTNGPEAEPAPVPVAPSWTRLAAASEQWALALAPVRAQPTDGGAVSRFTLAQSALQAAWNSVPVQDWANRVAMEATPVLAQWERLHHQEQPLTLAFNDAVQRYNAAIGQFPAGVMARLCGFRPAQALPLPPGDAA